MTAKTPQQIAELLASKCAVNWHIQPLEFRTPLSVHILQSIPLVELLELYQLDVHSVDTNNEGKWFCMCSQCVLLRSLETKLTQIIEGETNK